MQNVVLVLIVLIVLFETFAISCVKSYHETQCIKYFIYAVVSYVGVCYLLHRSFFYTGVALTNILWSGLSVMATTLVGITLFKEKFHFHDIIAAILIAAGVMIIRITD